MAGADDTTAVDVYQRLKEGARWMWGLGDYRLLAERLEPSAEALAAACAIRPGMRVLDVAAGNGNFAIAAARRGAHVVASDVTPRMVELGRARTKEKRLAIEWVEADAEELPFEDHRFDLVASVFGAMFAPRPPAVSREFVRVIKPGGTVAMANYSTEGFLARFAELLTRFAPSPARGLELPSPFLWGDADEVRSRFKGLARSVETEHRLVSFTFASLDEGWEFWERTNPPLMALKQMAPPERYQDLSQQGKRLMQELNVAGDGRLVLDSAYLQVLAVT